MTMGEWGVNIVALTAGTDTRNVGTTSSNTTSLAEALMSDQSSQFGSRGLGTINLCRYGDSKRCASISKYSSRTSYAGIPRSCRTPPCGRWIKLIVIGSGLGSTQFRPVLAKLRRKPWVGPGADE